jgi:rod shape-determining protein MreD
VKVVSRVALILFTAAVLERGVFSQLRIDGVAADVLLLVAISAGMVGGSDDGALVGFFAGLTLDLLVQTPLGLSALAYCVTGYVVGLAQGAVVRATRWQAPALAFAASFLGIGIYVAASLVVGRSGLVNRHLITVMLVVAVVNALFIGVVNRPMRWALGEPASRRAALR